MNKSILLYPSGDKLSGYGEYHDFRKISEYHTECAIETVDVLNKDRNLDKEIGARIMQIIFPA